MTGPSVRHSLIIRHPSRDLVLLLRDGGIWRLPTIATDDRHTAEVDYINGAVRDLIGVPTIFLRSLFHGPTPDANPVERQHELVARASDVVHGAAEWRDPTSLPDADLAATHRPTDGRDWELVAWWDDATSWIRRTLGERGIAVADVEQLRAWPSSSVLHVHTDAGQLYFKAVARSIGRECAVTAYLAEHFPGCVPAIVALDRERRWLLMRAVPGRKLEEVDALGSWQHAAHMYGALQMASRDHVQALRACGAIDRSLERLRHGLADLAHGHRELGDLLPALQLQCDALAAYAMPPMLEHGDLWPGNFLVDGASSVVIDWEDAAIAHPFFSIAPLLAGLHAYQPALATSTATEQVLTAYLDAFAPLASPARLRLALDLAVPLAFCDMALRYQQQPPSVVRLHPWMRGLVPEAVQRAVAAHGVLSRMGG